jgi:5-methylcytosine-specific restriction endonuclease McrA
MATRDNPVEWDRVYKTARWKRLRKHQLARHPLCKFCLELGVVTAANVVDHVVPLSPPRPLRLPLGLRFGVGNQDTAVRLRFR